MPVPFHAFSPEKAHCPACFAPFPKEPESCPFCGYESVQAVARFPFKPIPLTGLMDFEERLPPAGRKRIEKSIQRLRKTFPQIGVHVALMQLPDGIDAREFGFWWFNSATPSTQEEYQQRPWSILLLIDRNHRCTSVTTGYALEIFLGDMTLERQLAKIRDYFLAGTHDQAIAKFLSLVTEHLISRFADIRYAAKKFKATNPAEKP